MKLKIGVGSTVQVIAGSEKGKKGSVMAIDSTKLRIKVQGVKMQTHYSKEDGISQREGFIDYSNVKLLEAAKKSGKSAKKAAKK